MKSIHLTLRAAEELDLAYLVDQLSLGCKVWLLLLAKGMHLTTSGHYKRRSWPT